MYHRDYPKLLYRGSVVRIPGLSTWGHRTSKNKKTRVHEWRCSICSVRDPDALPLKFRNQHDFTEHAACKQDKNAKENKLLAHRLREHREHAELQRLQAVDSDCGRLLILVAWMISNGISLRIFPMVRALVLSQLLLCSLCAIEALALHLRSCFKKASF
jgi:hypothetical protein